MNIWGFIFIVLGIIVVTGLFQSGIEGFKSNALQSSWDATKLIGEKSKDAFDKGKEIINENRGTTDLLKNLGLPLCQEDNDCKTLSECKTGNCSCGNTGECFLKT